ncbi:Serine/threonine protein phosphatase 2A regulatory subunit B beta isoform [Zea mays]|uniref:Serine/threonine-protein phosphatase 2A 55 kDa regulatory subunit B n=1 Tax=Zea mays TaxID=4577 RepID=A0A3L6EVG9_MAIZE|nr:Serine/threonine protein phosphatase 2A regulatory subunit B beta isoform [Zea mays]
MSNSGRWRRRTRSVAPSPATSSPSSPGLREAQPFRLPQWKFSQVLGELPPAAEARRDGAPRPQDDDDADEISAIEFDGRGEYLAGGDNAGRVILFRRTDGDGDDARPRAELERTDRAGAPPPRYSYATEFQSHEREFDVLDSLDISERIKKVRWCARPNSSLLMLAANDRTVKLWKAAGDVGDGYSAKCRRVFGRAHEFNIHSVSTNCDGETLVSADDVRINLWHAEVTRQCFNIVDMKPADMEDLVEVITTAEFHPSSCSMLAYGSSSGLVRLVDLRRSALCDHSDRENRPQPSTFFSEIISCITDLKFTGDGEHLLTRDYMNLKLWDLRVETSPVATYKVHEFLRPKLSELYTDDYIFDRFGCCASNDGAYFATGSYRFLVSSSTETRYNTGLL